jgi:hypothetical protein
MFDSKKLTEVCIKYQITPNQFYVLYLVYNKDWESIIAYTQKVVRGFEENGNKITGFNVESELEPLVKKGYLMNWGTNNKFEYFDLALTPIFEEKIFVDTQVAGKELFDLYPHWLHVNGQRVIAKSCDKDLYMDKYAKKIGNSKDKHNKIIEDLKIAKEKDLINFKIANFIDGELWESLSDTGEDRIDKFKVI